MQNELHFTKMHGLGNDFVVVKEPERFDLASIDFRTLSDRHLGIGFDQFLLITESDKADFGCKIYNADGSEAEQCGNGMRCVAQFIHDEELSIKKQLTIETKAGLVQTELLDKNQIKINIGLPKILDSIEIKLDPDKKTLFNVSIGNPHAILLVTDIKAVPVHQWGSLIATLPAYPNGTNVGFMQIINSEKIKLRTYERGVGPTLACGSNACAAAIVGIVNNLLKNTVTVELALGCLTVQWDGNQHPAWLTGPTQTVYKGFVPL